MNVRTVRRLATRFTGALLALAMLAAPTLGRIQAAEICRLRCYPAAAAEAAGACCGAHAESTTRAHDDGQPGPADPATDASLKYCPGCNGRPIVADTPRLTLTLDPSPVFEPLSGRPASASFDVPFSIFHPPRA